MCMEDVNIDRALRTTLYVTDTEMSIPPNADRIGIYLTANDTFTAYLYAEKPGNQNTNSSLNNIRILIGQAFGGISTVAGSYLGFPFISLRQVGDILKGPLLLGSQGALGPVAAFDIWLPVNAGMSMNISKLP